MTDPREALSRLTRWRDCMGAKLGGSPQVPDAQFSGDVVALLSMVEKQQEALTDAAASLAGAASAYRTYARRYHKLTPRAVTDPVFTTRAADFEKAADRAGIACLALCLPIIRWEGQNQ